jgi:hypothetical protein
MTVLAHDAVLLECTLPASCSQIAGLFFGLVVITAFTGEPNVSIRTGGGCIELRIVGRGTSRTYPGNRTGGIAGARLSGQSESPAHGW